MKLSTRGRYGLKACFALAVSGEEVTPVSRLVKATGVSEKYLEQLLAMLKKGGILDSSRGNKGGYSLARPASQITLGQVFAALDELHIADCDTSCGDDYCPNRRVFIKLQNSITDLLDSITLQEYVSSNCCERMGKID